MQASRLIKHSLELLYQAPTIAFFRINMATQYIIAGIAAAGLAFWYDFKSWQSFGSHYHSHLKARC
jgi:hypothetical protein